MVYEFEGRTEKEAIDRAAEELGLQKDDFDVEILETQRSGLFKKGFVKIQVHTNQNPTGAAAVQGPSDGESAQTPSGEPRVSRPAEGSGEFSQAVFGDPEAKNDFEKKMVAFTEGLIERMGYPGKVSVLFREEKKIGLKIDSEHSSILIGKKGKNLDALQLLANIYAGRQGREDMRVILDSENYRIRREESLVRLAYTVAERVRESRGSILLEPMNPFDRRLIHTTLNDIADVETKSEGEGLYKQVRVYYRGLRSN
ncbi:RNA-binding cell elongation regulator Jag/EloR [Leadbettera azotonutricia]|uniref:RNA-binding protein KhpB n=1 Tax=Leadbettera azotonutricia (strain ATCC BAA-888 / DSM 13862 / ZAS-9) TaxID=545695 RepID=F5Y9C2_LEAAZ|nr:RNA-binding cell elongation regulator Jag/EloR [Leadbettera azotonutricia]AEF82143.1 spoiiij-associated protein [Leadbettera azotonutricia ZAS-9]